MKRLLATFVFAITCPALPAYAAESFPAKPIRFIVPFPPGGGSDAFARIVTAKIMEDWGQQFVIDNRGGAQGSLGTALGAKANPDGYTITLAHQGALVINPHLYRNTGYDSLRDFAPVTRGMVAASVLVVHPSVAATSMKELAALAQKNPGKLTFASTASLQQLLGEMFRLATRTDIVHVPYKGAGPAVLDLLAGNVTMMFANPTSTVPQVKAGRLRALAVLGSKRNDALPDVPTATEAGYREFNDILEWYGVAAPAATPRAIVERLNAGWVKALNSPDVVARMHAIGQTASPTSTQEFARQIRSEYAIWGKVVRESGAKVD